MNSDFIAGGDVTTWGGCGYGWGCYERAKSSSATVRKEDLKSNRKSRQAAVNMCDGVNTKDLNVAVPLCESWNRVVGDH